VTFKLADPNHVPVHENESQLLLQPVERNVDQLLGSSSNRNAVSRPAVRISQRNLNNTFNFSINRFTTEDLTAATHWHTLEYFPRPYYSLNIDPYLMGLGGDDSVSASVGDDYLLQPDSYSFDLLFNFFDDA
jgi:hypothetical protein